MHESSLAKQILDAVLARAADASAKRVGLVRGWIAETEALSPDSLDFHFRAHAAGTLAEGATLDLRLVHVEARCSACHTTYPPEHHLLLCPSCGSTEGDLLGQVGVGIDTLEIDE
jgi:hydrogenase nickel incorporation protein HypA/HybF